MINIELEFKKASDNFIKACRTRNLGQMTYRFWILNIFGLLIGQVNTVCNAAMLFKFTKTNYYKAVIRGWGDYTFTHAMRETLFNTRVSKVTFKKIFQALPTLEEKNKWLDHLKIGDNILDMLSKQKEINK